MIVRNSYMGCFDCIKDANVNGEHLTLTVSHRLDPERTDMSGWFVSVTTHDPATDDVDWGFCSGWHESYHKAIECLKSNQSYKRYPFPC